MPDCDYFWLQLFFLENKYDDMMMMMISTCAACSDPVLSGNGEDGKRTPMPRGYSQSCVLLLL